MTRQSEQLRHSKPEQSFYNRFQTDEPPKGPRLSHIRNLIEPKVADLRMNLRSSNKLPDWEHVELPYKLMFFKF